MMKTKNKWSISFAILLLIVGCEDKNEIYQNEGGLIDGIYTVYANMYYNPLPINYQGDSKDLKPGFHDVKIT